MTCEACTHAAEHPGSGLYHASCPECQHRRAYLETVQRKHGDRATEALKAAYLEWWEQGRAKA